jgi:hypothetical protein
LPGLVPGIHVFEALKAKQDVDGRDKLGHDEKRLSFKKLERPPKILAAFSARLSG